MTTDSTEAAREPKWFWWAGLDEDEYRLAGPCATREEAISNAYGETEPGDTIYLVEAIAEDEDDGEGLYAFIETRNRSSIVREEDGALDARRELLANLVRPIIGIENRTGQEVFDIMADRIRHYIKTER